MLVSGRAAVGWSAILAPKLLAKAWGVNSPLRSDIKYAIRLFGIRNVILAYQLYQAERLDADPEELEEILRQGIAVDIFDVLSGVGARMTKPEGDFAAGLPVIASLAGVILGFLGRENSELFGGRRG